MRAGTWDSGEVASSAGGVRRASSFRVTAPVGAWPSIRGMSRTPARIVLVTGGAKGVGRGISEAFLADGATVIACGREAPAQLPGGIAEFIACDVRKREQVDAMFDQIAQRHGRLDVLVNNAGGAPFALADRASPRFHESIVALNLLAPLKG